MSSCFVKRVVPFVLALVCGVALWRVWSELRAPVACGSSAEYGRRARDLSAGDPRAEAPPGDEQSRTWLVIRSTPLPVRRAAAAECDGCSVRMRVLFGDEGAVPGNAFSLKPSSYPLIEEAVAAARKIEFTRATRNGWPVPVWANVTYACSETYVPHASRPGTTVCSLSIDKESARTSDGRPWRLIYE